MSVEKIGSAVITGTLCLLLIFSTAGIVSSIDSSDQGMSLQQEETKTTGFIESPGFKEEGMNYNRVIHDKGTGLAPPSIEDYDWWLDNVVEGEKGIYTVGDRDYLTEFVNGMDDDLSGEKLPSYVDHTQSAHFPPIGNQGQQGSCTAFSFSYYLLTFMIAQEYNYTVNTFGQEFASTSKSPTYADKIMSPAWSYNHVNDGEDIGSNWIKHYRFANSVGNSNWQTMPYDEYDYISWGTETAYRNAPQYRVTGYEFLHMDEDEFDNILTILKTWLHEDYLISFNVDTDSIHPWRGDAVLSSIEMMEKESNHAQTVIGYDDDMIDTDGSGEVGAFLIANSWGDWGPYKGDYHAGTYWITYEAFVNHLARRHVRRLTGNGVYDGSVENSPELLGTWSFTNPGYRDPEVRIGIAYDVNGTVLEEIIPDWPVSSEHLQRYPEFIAVDLTDFVSIWDYGNGANHFFLYMGESEGKNSLIETWLVEYYEHDYVWNNKGDNATRHSLIPKNVPGTNPITLWTSFTSTIGDVSFDSSEYAEFDTIGITVEDEDLMDKQNVYIEVSSSLDCKIVQLTQNKRYMHIWEGTIDSSRSNGEDELHVKWGDTITVIYLDLSHDQERTDTAKINLRTKTDTIRIHQNADFFNDIWAGNGTETAPWTITRLEIDNGGSGYGLYIGNVTDHFLVQDCYIYNSKDDLKSSDLIIGGIYLYNSTNGLVKDSIVTENNHGVYLENSFDNYIVYNNIHRNLYGIYLFNSTINYVSSNRIQTNRYGLFSRDSDRNYLGYNNISQNDYGAYLHNTQEKHMENNIIYNNEHGIYIKDSPYNKIDNNHLWKNDYGIYIWNSSDIYVLKNILFRNVHGVYLRNSLYNRVKDNSVTMNDHGIHMSYARNNEIVDNIVYRNEIGLFSDMYSDSNIIAKNHAYLNIFGLKLSLSNNNIIAENIVENNFEDGMQFNRSNSNSVVMNTIYNNERHGLVLKSSYENRVYHNNFVDNAYQAKCSGENLWDNGYPFGGNYWSDLTSVNEDKTSDKKISDVPYIGEGFSDRYPFISPVQNTSYPIINIYHPSDGQEIVSNNVTVRWNSYRADYHEVKMDNCKWISTGGSMTLTYEYVGDGEYTIRVRAWDVEGNSTVESVKFNVNTTENVDHMWNHITIIIISIIAIVLITLKRHFGPKYALTRKTLRDKGSF